MLYLPELYYFEQKNFPLQRAVSITAVTVSQWCTYFYAKVITPRIEYTGTLEKEGPLPENVYGQESFVADLVEWLFNSSAVDEPFCLLLDDKPIPGSDKVAKFDHHDGTCCWALNLTEEEFAHLQVIWKANDLPEDLFHPEQMGLCVPYPGAGLRARLLRALGVKKCYTPKQWEYEGGRQERTA